MPTHVPMFLFYFHETVFGGMEGKRETEDKMMTLGDWVNPKLLRGVSV